MPGSKRESPCPTSQHSNQNPRRDRRRRRRSRAGSRARRSARQEGLDLGAARDARQDVAGRTQDARRGDQSRQGRGHAGARRAARHAEIRSARCAARSPRPSTSRCRCARRRPRRAAIHPLSQVMDELTAIFADMGFADRRRSRHRDRRLQFHKTEFPRGPSGAGDARHLLLQSEGGRFAHAVAHPYLAGAGAHHADARSRRSA